MKTWLKFRKCVKDIVIGNATDIYSSLEPIYYVSRILGLSGYNYLQKDDGLMEYITSTIGNVYNMILIMSFSAYYVYGSGNRTDQGFVHKNLINKAIDTFQLYSVATVMAIGILANTWRQKCLIEAVKKIHDLDLHLERISLYPNHIKTRKYTFIGTLAILATYLTLECMNCSMYIKQIVLFSNICFFMCIVPLMVNGVLIGQFITFVMIIKHRFSLVNRALIKLQNGSKQRQALVQMVFRLDNVYPVKILDERVVMAKILRTVRACQIVHAQLCEISCLINRAFELQILINITLSFIGFTTYTYYCFDGVVDLIFMVQSDVNLYDILTSVLWALSKLAQIFFISWACHATCNEAKSTGKLLYKIDQRFEKDLARELGIFGKQMLHWNTAFTACGFFDLDMKLFYSVVCASTTYLMILIQLEGQNQ